MFGASPLTVLLIVWAAITLVFLAVLGWKSIVGMREEDVLILDPAEAKQAAEQQQLIATIERLTAWVKGLGFTSLGLLIIIGGIWIYRGWQSFNSGQVPP